MISIKPFGPEIKLYRLPDDICNTLYNICTKNSNAMTNLGNTKTNILEDCLDEITPYLKSLVVDYINNTESIYKKYTPINENDLDCNQFWYNYSHPNQHYPVHRHPFADVVCVCYPKVEMVSQNKAKFNNFKAGSITLVQGSFGLKFGDTFFNHEPKTGDVLIFPGELYHSTVPTSSHNDIRISTSSDFTLNDNFFKRNNVN